MSSSEEEAAINAANNIIQGKKVPDEEAALIARIFAGRLSTTAPFEPIPFPTPTSLAEALELVSAVDQGKEGTLCNRLQESSAFMIALAHALQSVVEHEPTDEHQFAYESICKLVTLLVDHHDVYHCLLEGIHADLD